MSINGRHINVLQTLQGHVSDVTSCDFAPNFTLVTGSSDKTVRIWEWIPGTGYTERPNSPLRGHKYQVTCVRVSQQGSLLASASVDGTALLWNLHSLTRLYTLTQVNGDAIRVCRFSPDSALLVTAGDNGAVCIWDLIHRSLIRTLFEHEGTTQSLAFTPDSQYLITACSLEVIRVWSVQELVDTTSESAVSAVARVDNVHDMGVLCLEVSRHIDVDENNPLVRKYNMASSGNDNEIKLWTITSKSILKNKNTSCNEVRIEENDNLDGHSSSVTCVKFSNNGAYVISCSLDKLIKIWDTSSRTCLATLQGHTRYVNCVSVSRDFSLVASGSNDKQVIVWDLTGKITKDTELFGSISVPHVHDVQESQLMENNELKILEKIEDIFEGGVNSCCFYGNNLLATGSGDKLVRLFKVVEENNNIEELCISPFEGHTYAINHVEFSSDFRMLASCSLDGSTIIWNPSTGEKYISMPVNSLSIKVCRFSPNCQVLVTAGDDEKAIIWDAQKMEQITTLEGHMDAVTCVCISPDNDVIVTVSCNADFRVWLVNDNLKCGHVHSDAHEYGIQSCDFSQNLEPIPNMIMEGQSYLLATCGNDSLVKLWRITLPKKKNKILYNQLQVKLWRPLQGHGGNVLCVRFSPFIGELVCSTATDRQARIWSVYSTECLHVLDHDSIVTSCSFSADCSLLATGCLDKTLWIWRLPQQLVFQTAVAKKIKCRTKAVVDWTTDDTVKWLRDISMDDIIENVQNTSLSGERLLTLSENAICSGLDLSEEQTERMLKELRWLKKEELQIDKPQDIHIPNEFLCPITHEIMREPVMCCDGFTYEKKAIAEWFMSGKFTSPMTNEPLASTDYEPNLELRDLIRGFLDEVEDGSDKDG